MSAIDLHNPTAGAVSVRADVFDFSAIPALGPLPLLLEPAPARSHPSRSGSRTILAVLAIGFLSVGAAGWYADIWSAVGGRANRAPPPVVVASTTRVPAADLREPTTTGAIPLALRPTLR